MTHLVRGLVLALSLFTLSSCSTVDRKPAAQSSPEIDAQNYADLAATPLRQGDRLAFKGEVRFPLGSNSLVLGSTSGRICQITVEPPRGARVQNYVQAGKILTLLDSGTLTPGLPTVTITTYSDSRDRTMAAKMQSIYEGLRARGYDVSQPDRNSKSYIRETIFPGRDAFITYALGGTTLHSTLECRPDRSSYRNRVSVYGPEDLKGVDKAIAAFAESPNVGEMYQIVQEFSIRNYDGLGGFRLEFLPARRPQQNYRKMPIDYFQPARQLEDVPQNSI